MIFSALYACPTCKLRFPKRATCPSCGAAAVMANDAPSGSTGAGFFFTFAAWMQAFFAFFGAARLAASVAPRALPAASTRMRLFFPPEPTTRDESIRLTGVARRASTEIEGVISGEKCLLFGVRGEVGSADVADADGGDFDLELPSGERVMISLEHAQLVASPDTAALNSVDRGTPLADFLETRGIAFSGESTAIVEILVRDGDEVTIFGTELSGTVTSFGASSSSSSSGGRSRVIAGTEERPLIVRVT